MGKTICIVSQSHISRNPRVLKEALALMRAGYTVHILTAIHSRTLLEQDLLLLNNSGITYEFYSDLRISNLTSFKARLVKSLATTLQQKFNIQSKFSLGYSVPKLKKLCIAINADLYIMHQELATCVGAQLIKHHRKVAFDLEDWYSEDLLPQARNRRPIALLKKAESVAVNSGAYCATTSSVLAKKLTMVYAGKPPTVIYNVFPSPFIPAVVNKTYTSPVKLFWFSQTIGPGRGLEQFISLLANVKNGVELHLLGAIDNTYKSILTKLLASRHAIRFHPLVPEPELAQKIAGFDVGLALELDDSLSRNYTITNKFFQYIQSGLPVIVTATAGQAEAFELYQPGLMLSPIPDNTVINALENWLNNPEDMLKASIRAKEAAKIYNWENESKKLLQLVQDALK